MSTAVSMLAARSLAQRELVRFFRQPHRVVGAVATPVVFWLLIGLGMNRSFADGNYLAYFFPGTIVMVVLFTAIFSTISLIDDRNQGFLQGVLVAPVPRSAIVLGKVAGSAVLAWSQGLLLLAAVPFMTHVTLGGMLAGVAITGVMAFALAALGFAIAWGMSSTQGFHAIMNLVLMPMWFLSGALFPAGGAWIGMNYLMHANPLFYGLALLRGAIGGGATSAPPVALSAAVSIAFALVTFIAAARVARDRSAA